MTSESKNISQISSSQGLDAQVQVCPDSRKCARTSAENTRQSILRIAAKLFAIQGYTATSTRLIAERVGIKQPTLYYYFPHKQDILAELLLISVRPSVEIMRKVDQAREVQSSPYITVVLLAYLIKSDLETLNSMHINASALYSMPEVSELGFTEFHRLRRELCLGYGTIASQAALHAMHEVELLGNIINTIVEYASTQSYKNQQCEYDHNSLVTNIIFLILSMLGYATEQIEEISRELPYVNLIVID